MASLCGRKWLEPHAQAVSVQLAVVEPAHRK